jgi:hypothetical protein
LPPVSLQTGQVVIMFKCRQNESVAIADVPSRQVRLMV